jgi:hypothetical protein
MPQPVTYNPGTPVSGSIQENSISYVVDGQNRNYRGGFGGLSWMSEVPAANNVIFIGNSVSLGRGPANIPLFYPSYNNSAANIIYAANTLPGSPRNFTTTGSAYNWAATNNFFINNSDNPIPRIDADGLAFYLDASQPTSYPQTGTSWYDMSGFNRNSTLTNGPTYNSNGWIEFDGADDRSTTSFGFLSNSESHEAWIYSKGNVSGYNMFMGIILPYYGFFTGNTFIVQDYVGGNQVGYYTGTLSLNRWYHFLNTRSYNGTNTTLTTYINGTLSNQSTYSGAPSIAGGTWAIGNWDAPSAGASYPFYGNISGAKIYTQALTEAQVKQNYFQGNIVTGSLVFMVDANNLVSYPKSGTSWYTLTGSVASGSLINGPTFSPSNGGSIVFDGVDDYIRTTYNSAYDFSNANFSMEAWFYSNPTANGNYTSICNRATYGSNERSFELFIANDTGTPYIWFGVFNSNWTYVNNSSLTGIQFNEWNHVIATSDGVGNGKVYINGVLRQTNSSFNTAVTATTVPFLIGAYVGGAVGGFFNGKIPVVKLYNKALTSDEVQQNYQATKDKFLGQNIVTNGLVLNLDSANKDSYPGTGTTWYDLSGNGNNGTLLNGVAFNANKNGGVMYFDDTDDTVSIGNSSLFSITNAMTVFAWVNPSSTSGWDGIFGGSISGFVHFQLYFGTINVYIYGPNVSYSNNDSYSVPANAWISIGFTYDGTTLKVYVNGSQLATTVPGSGNVNSNSDVRVGWAYDTSRVFGGFIGTTQVYNRALSATEVLQNYNAQKIRFGL